MVNKTFRELDDKNWLREQRKIKTCAEIAADLGAFHYSVSWACRVFTPDEQREFKWARRSAKLK